MKNELTEAEQKASDIKAFEKAEIEAKAKRIQDDLQRAKDERAKREDEREQAAKELATKTIEVATSNGARDEDGVSLLAVRQLPTDTEVVRAIMSAFGVSSTVANQLIERAAENLRAAA